MSDPLNPIFDTVKCIKEDGLSTFQNVRVNNLAVEDDFVSEGNIISESCIARNILGLDAQIDNIVSDKLDTVKLTSKTMSYVCMSIEERNALKDLAIPTFVVTKLREGVVLNVWLGSVLKWQKILISDDN